MVQGRDFGRSIRWARSWINPVTAAMVRQRERERAALLSKFEPKKSP
jgi:hypothetical protein